MSKMRGNVLNPLEMTRKYGTDALRFALTTGTSPGNDVSLSQQRIEAGRNFANKIWNASRFILKSIESNQDTIGTAQTALNLEDRWIISRLNRVTGEVNRLLEDYQFGEAERQIYDFFWDEFCDWYLEIAKLRLRQGQTSCLKVLIDTMETSLRLLHPFMPFITEEIWQSLRRYLPYGETPESIVIAPYPQINTSALDTTAEDNLAIIIQVVRSIRNIRAKYKIPPTKPIPVLVCSDDFVTLLSGYSEIISNLAGAQPLTVITRDQKSYASTQKIVDVVKGAEVIVQMSDAVDIEAERVRLEKEIKSNVEAIKRLEARLEDPDFVSRAPPAVIEKEKSRLAEYTNRLNRLKHELSQLD